MNFLKQFFQSTDGAATPQPLPANLLEQELAVVFKHSQTCPVSWAAQRRVNQFAADHPSVSLYTVIVQKNRELSNQLAASTGVRHESPQILVFRRGNVTSHTSHEQITVDYLVEATRP
ncbi:MAG: bacillithiol system redox-active protein YtxJ [Acidobacteria bacterium]|nr:bacillithiol system redox-active protein YtxJ [Acidobacteriota bacterium]